MVVQDLVKKTTVEVDRAGLIKLMDDGRQIDFVLSEPVSDEDGYMTWDVEHWSQLQPKKYVRTYEYQGKTLSEITHFNIYDMKAEFDPDRAKEVAIS